MQYQIDGFKLSVSKANSLEEAIKKKYHLNKFKFEILLRSIDARNKNDVLYVYRLLIITDEPITGKNVTEYLPKPEMTYPKVTFKYRPIVVGFGPAGIFASLYLARCGAKPIIIERGSCIEQRIKDVQSFIKDKKLNQNSNVQFGEGGAGTFSDGKLTTNVKSELTQFILKEFYLHGASKEITYDSMPHIGTDKLREVVKNIRIEIESLGGTFYFNTTFEKVEDKEEHLLVYALNHSFKTRHLLLGIGHSAKDTLRYLYNDLGLKMEAKAFSMGVRIEHLASMINESQYGKFAKYLPNAYYKLACHNDDRGIYTFCMCPGGYVLASTSEDGRIVTNGMSNSKRDATNSNSALLVDVKPSDFNNDILEGLAYQEKYEKLAFSIAGDYRAPANLVKEFLNDEIAKSLRSVIPSYPHGVILTDLKKCLPDFVIKGLKYGIYEFSKKLRGFSNPDAVLTGVETRSSSPVRILRNEHKEASLHYIYPIGEGAGYAGGITSASIDGLKTAMQIVFEVGGIYNEKI